MEKAREIRVKADEEFAIEKVRWESAQRTSNIHAVYRRNSSNKNSRPLTPNTRRSARPPRSLRRCAQLLDIAIYGSD